MAVSRDFEDLLRCLNAAKVRYLVVGAHAVSFYTEPRYTKDIDIWVEPSNENAKCVYKALKKFGAPVGDLEPEDLTDPKMVYQIGVAPLRADIMMGVEKLNFTDAWKHKKRTTFGKQKVYLVGINDLMTIKKALGRPQDKLDLTKLSKAKKK